MIIKVLYTNYSDTAITGGQIYEQSLFNIIKKNKNVSDFKIIETGMEKGLFTSITNISKLKKTDIVFFNSSKSHYWLLLVLLMRLFIKTKIVVIHHHNLYEEFKGIKRFIFYIFEMSLLLLSHRIIIPSPYIYHKFDKICFTKKRVLIKIPFYSNEKVEKHAVDNKTLDLIYIGTIEERKGLIYLLQALNTLKIDYNESYNLSIIGKTIKKDYYKELKKYIKTNDLNVDFKGFVTDKEKHKLLCNSKLFVFPSLLEGYGMVMIEAMQYGLPVIAFDNSAMPFVISDGINGLIAKNKNADDFALKIHKVLNDKDLYNRLSLSALKTFKNSQSHKDFELDINSLLDIFK